MNARPRIALLIGGASGIGLASAEALARAGLRVAIADLEPGSAGAVANRLPGEGHAGYVLDVSQESQVIALFRVIEAEMGPVAVLGNFAGIAGYVDGRKPSLAETSLAKWEAVFSVNITGVFLSVREMLKHRGSSPVPHGRIINISSMAAQNGGGNSPASYVASKGAVAAFTKAAAIEAALLGITANCVSPGAIDTPMLRAVMPRERDSLYFAAAPAGRVGSPEEAAAAVAFLASPEAAYITGACIDVNGGMRMN